MAMIPESALDRAISKLTAAGYSVDYETTRIIFRILCEAIIEEIQDNAVVTVIGGSSGGDYKVK